MNEILNWIAVSFAFGGIAFWLFGIINMFRMVVHRKPGVPLFPSWYESPFNVIFRPGNLTDTGLRARRNLLIGFGGFFGCAAVMALIAVLSK